MYYPGGSQSPQIQFYTSQPAAEPTNINRYQGLTAQQVYDRNVSYAQRNGASISVQPVPKNPSPDDKFFCRELDGSWSPHTATTIMNSKQPGQWVKDPNGKICFIRHAKG